ncbi:efflux RND transporter periplasmic adaptor subunit [Alcanivorax sp. JB21]|uniref:efflux RND transporter periplasmic adaptor subunit n=1 Tax=Alcanivorax limicola TaxID=2874102 RepID=UPI001CBFA049|nr:efflux RND transporter periplasmic adaptor subunit [Alcanivorax limicola]MBZ2188509.1 efflux RND transporter periplasmic adaptor subunit [Alcanivorax limicola]
MRLRSPSRSVQVAIVLGVLLLIWLLSGERQSFRDQVPEADTETERAATLSRVEVRDQTAEQYQARVRAQGQLLPWRELALRARTAGQVDKLLVREGARVNRNAVILELDQEDLPARLARTEAELAAQRAELAGAERLQGRGLSSESELLRLRSTLAQAEAEHAALRQQMTHTRPRAPFAGVINRLVVEEGDFLQVGEVYADLVEDQRLKASAWVSQRDITDVAPGLPVQVTLLDGEVLDGEVIFVASRADESTRSYRVDVEVANPAQRRLAGASATLDIALPERPAHRLSPALLVLDDDGKLAVRHLDDDDRVLLTRVRLLSATSRAAWVSGLPEHVRLITVGGGFVAEGDQVDPRQEAEEETKEAPPSTPGEGQTGELS